MNILRKYLSAIMLLTALCALAVPAKRDPRTFTQPDGTQVTLRLVGDEFMHYYLTDDNQMVVASSGGYYFAKPSSGRPVASSFLASDSKNRTLQQQAFLMGVNQTELTKQAVAAASSSRMMSGPRRAIAQNGVGLFPENNVKHSGSPHFLIILVQYKDVKFNTSYSASTYFTNMLSQVGFSQYSGTGSAYDFFNQTSKGKFTPSFDVYGPVTLANNRSYYGGNDSNGNDKAPEQMVYEACKILDSQIDFSQYDTDGDGEVDNVFVFYAGQGEASYGNADTVWPHAWFLYDGAGVNLKLDGVRINRYGCTNEWNDGRPDGVGTFIHEFSHVLGLPDLYVTDYNSSATKLTPGAYDVMDYGPYNNDGCTPPTYSAYERNAMGWADITVLNPDEGKSETLEHIFDSNKAYLIPTSSTNEFFLLENRQKSGWDKYIPGHGMLIWHIDYNSTVWNANKPNNTASHQYVDIEEAGGSADNTNTTTMAKYPFPGTANKTSFTSSTNPALKSWAGAAINVPITNIKEVGGVISFDACGGAPVIPDEPDEPDTPTGNGTYTLVTSTSSLSAGDRILIVAHEDDYAMSTTQNTYNRGQAAVVKQNYTITPGEDVQVITLETASANSSYFDLYTGEGYLYASSSSNNYLKTATKAGANTAAEISIASTGVATITFKGSYTHNTMMYNSTNGLFSCYLPTTTTQKSVSIYKENKGDIPPVTIVVEKPTSNVEGTEITCSNAFNLVLTPANQNDVIHYTWMTNTSESADDVVYTKPITISEYTYLEAWSERDGVKSDRIELTFNFKVATPVITPETGEFDEMPSVTITSATRNAKIYYTLDGSNPTTSSIPYTGAFTPDGYEVEVKAIATYSNWTPSDISDVMYIVNEPEESDEPTIYSLVNDANTLKSGDKIIIVAANADKALSKTQNGNNRQECSIVKNADNTIDIKGTKAQVITLERNSSFWNLNVDNGYLYTPNNSNNYLRTEAELDSDGNANVNISISSAGTVIEFAVTKKNIKYNSTSNIFSCYKTDQAPIVIYRQVNNTPYSAYFDNSMSGWDNVYCYTYATSGNAYSEENAAFPGVKLSAGENGLYEYSEELGFEPKSIIFSDGNGKKTIDLIFVDGHTYDALGDMSDQRNTYIVFFDDTASQFGNVYCYLWNGTLNNYGWPGQKMTLENGLHKLSISLPFEPSNIIFSNGNHGTGNESEDFEFVNGKIYSMAVEEENPTDESYTYQLVTKYSDIVDGCKYIIVSPTAQEDGNYYAMGTSNAANVTSQGYRKAMPIAVNGDIATIDNSVTPFTLEAFTEDGQFCLKMDDGNYLQFVGKSTTNLRETTVNNTNDAAFTFTLDTAVGHPANAWIIANASYDTRALKFNYDNGTNPRFSNFASTYNASQPYVSIYKQIADDNENPGEGGDQPGGEGPGGDETIGYNATYDFTKLTEAPADMADIQINDYLTMSFVKSASSSSEPAWNTSSKDARLYAGGTLTIDAKSDYVISNVTFNISKQGMKRLTEITPSVGAISDQGVNPLIWEGKSSQVVFIVGDKAVYGSDGAEKAGQLCIDALTIHYFKGSMTGISTVASDYDPNEAIEYYNLQGVRVHNPGPGLYIVRKGSKVMKQLIK